MEGLLSQVKLILQTVDGTLCVCCSLTLFLLNTQQEIPQFVVSLYRLVSAETVNPEHNRQPHLSLRSMLSGVC